MTFRIALSGLNAAQSDLNVTANNIANANTNGFKGSRAEFADFFPVSSYGVSNNAVGAGVHVSRISQEFTQGAINFTDNALDLAVSGEGFFTLDDDGSQVYTRSGAFGTDRDGYVVNGAGNRLQVYAPSGIAGVFNTGAMSDLQISNADNPPAATTRVDAGFNLPANASAPSSAPFLASDPASYNQTTSVTVYDSLGAAHNVNLFFVKTATPNQWEMHTQVDGTAVSGPDTLQYSASGALTTPAGGTLALPAYTPTTGAAALSLNLGLSGSTQFGSSFGVGSLTQDGYASGRLSGLSISPDGVVQARYTNGQEAALGKLAMANFANPQGLQPVSDTTWGETYGSGSVIHGEAGTTNFGQIQSGALEGSNVDLTEQLVNMITAQRNFQANAQMISTADQVTQTIINIR